MGTIGNTSNEKLVSPLAGRPNCALKSLDLFLILFYLKAKAKFIKVHGIYLFCTTAERRFFYKQLMFYFLTVSLARVGSLLWHMYWTKHAVSSEVFHLPPFLHVFVYVVITVLFLCLSKQFKLNPQVLL